MAAERAFVDLHTHTTASDGTDAPADLVAKADAAELAAVAVTDHDTLAGLDQALEAGRSLEVDVVSGCELAAATEWGELHILGLWLPRRPHALLERLAWLRRRRAERNAGIVDKLRALGLEITMEDVLAEAGGASVGRPHIAAALLRKGYVRDRKEAFQAYLGKQGRAYLPKVTLEAEDAVRLLREEGATVSLAHPLLWKAPPGWLEGQVAHLADCGLDAIEAWHSEHSEDDVRVCLGLARKYGLAVTGGSDYHGANKPTISLGRGHGGLRVSVGVYRELQERRARAGLPV